MARGWESKSVEEQISAKEADRKTQKKAPLAADETQLRSKREGLVLSRTRTIAALESAKDERYRAILRTALADLEKQISELT